MAGTYHTGRFTKVPRLAKLLRVITPADRNPGRPWRRGTPPPAPQRAAEILGVTTPAGARFGSSAEFLLLVNATLGQVMEQWQHSQAERNTGHRS